MSQTQPKPVQLSILESLPAEIIQKIFLFSLEVNLPRASIHIARVLSTPLLYTWLLRVAFSSTNESSRHDFFTRDYLPEEADVFALSLKERAKLQTAILECRWCTLSLMRKCQQEYICHVLRRKCQDLIFSPEDQRTLSNISSYFKDLRRYDHGSMGRRGRGDLLLRAKKPDKDQEDQQDSGSGPGSNSDRAMLVAIWFHFGAVEIRRPGPVYFTTDLFQFPSCAEIAPARMPDKLLQAPWSEPKLEFLRLLSLDAYIDEDSSCARSKRVVRQLIRERDFETFQVLLRMYMRKKDYNYPFLWPVRRCHFLDALSYAEGKSDPFVALLFQERWDDVPMRDKRVKDFLMSMMF